MHLKHMMAIGALLTASVLLSGCGGSSNDNANQNPGKPSTDDAFITAVRAHTDGSMAMSDESEPVDIMSINATSPEETEPQAVTF